MESRFPGPESHTSLLGRATDCALLDDLIDEIRDTPGVEGTMTAVALSTIGEDRRVVDEVS